MEFDPILTPIYAPEAQMILGLHLEDYLAARRQGLLPASWKERYRETSVIRRHTFFDLLQYWRFANGLFCPVAVATADFSELWSHLEREVFRQEVGYPAVENVQELGGSELALECIDGMDPATGGQLVEFILAAIDCLLARTLVALECAETDQFALVTRFQPQPDPFARASIAIHQRS